MTGSPAISGRPPPFLRGSRGGHPTLLLSGAARGRSEWCRQEIIEALIPARLARVLPGIRPGPHGRCPEAEGEGWRPRPRADIRLYDNIGSTGMERRINQAEATAVIHQVFRCAAGHSLGRTGGSQPGRRPRARQRVGVGSPEGGQRAQFATPSTARPTGPRRSRWRDETVEVRPRACGSSGPRSGYTL